MNDDQLDQLLRAARDDYNRPPEPPREAMWQAIAARRQPAGAGVLPFRRTLARKAAWPVGIAALLALGFGLGRLSSRGGHAGAPGPVAAASRGSTQPSPALASATLQHLSRSEAFLTGFRVEAGERKPDAALLSTARDLLGTTRLLLDSPGLKDARMRSLLEELEVVLAQVTQLQAEPDREDTDLIVHQLDEQGVLPRLRTAIPAGPAITPGES
jgi:hypothetical protein